MATPTDTNSLNHILRSQIQLTESHLPSLLLASLSAQLDECDDELNALAARRAVLLRLQEGVRWSRSPIRRVPTEILTEIFAVVVASPFRTLPLEWGHWGEFGLEELAQQDVLRLAQVCCRWRAIIFGVHSLWSFLRISPDLWIMDSDFATALLRRALERSGNSPLTIAISNDAPPTVIGAPLALLAAHSTRWRRADFKCYPLPLSWHVPSIRGRLPLLEELYLHQGIPLLFDITPKLTRLYIDHKAIWSLASLSLEQLIFLSIMPSNPAWLPYSISHVARLPPGSHFSLSFSLDNWTSERSRNIEIDIPHIMSTIGELTIQATSEFHEPHCKQTLTAVLSALTLPNLHTLSLQSEHADRFPLVWAHSAFVALCQRSALGDHLRELDLSDVHIAEGTLRQCLSLLPALTHLAISDHERIRGRGVNLDLISDTLLGALMEHDEPMAMVLVPHLEQLSLRSRHAFTDAKLLDMIRSRVIAVDGFRCMLRIMRDFQDSSRKEHLEMLARERGMEISRIDGRKLRLTIQNAKLL
ncbi:hypothetical protein C8F01DRAFT_1232097 [Mycena amicta]|nr:hypothetical protein C8F01DRAFT_1232097 [Mycena amicta]